MHLFWGLLFGLVLLGALVLTAVSPALGWWLPLSASSYSPDIDRLYYLILGVVTVFYVLTEAILVYNIVKSGAPGRKAQFTHGSHSLELIWSIIPGIILVLLAVIQVQTWASIKYPTHLADSIEKGESYFQMGIEARQWEFRMRFPSAAHIAEWDKDPKAARADYAARLPERYDDIWIPNDVHVWKGQKVLIHFKTRDVGHALFFPNLRLKQDALPGRTIPVWFEATESNTMFNEQNGQKHWLDGWRADGANKWVQDKDYIFDLVCTQYCGTRHSLMRGKLFVHPNKEDFLAWLKHAQEVTNGRHTNVAATP